MWRGFTDEQWERIEPHLPRRRENPRGGRPWANDRRALEGILWILWTGSQWSELPRDRYPSASTCWRRLKEWEEDGTLKNLWRAFPAQLNEQQRVRWDECFADGTFIAAKKRGAKAGKTKRGKGTKLMVLADGEGLSSARTRGFRTSDAFMFAMSG